MTEDRTASAPADETDVWGSHGFSLHADAESATQPSAEEVLDQAAAEVTTELDTELTNRVKELLNESRKRLLKETPMLTAAELRTVHTLDVQRTIILVDPEGGIRIPRFQFTEVNGHFDLIPVVRTTNERMLANQDPWGAADWWLGKNNNVLLWNETQGNYYGCPADHIGTPGEYNIPHIVTDLLENDSFG